MSAASFVYDAFHLWLPCTDTFAHHGQNIMTESWISTEQDGSAQYGAQPKRCLSKFSSLQIAPNVGVHKYAMPGPVSSEQATCNIAERLLRIN